MGVYEELEECLLKSASTIPQLQETINKISTVQTFLLVKQDNTKKSLITFVQNLKAKISFLEQDLQGSIDRCLKDKQQYLDEVKTELSDHIVLIRNLTLETRNIIRKEIKNQASATALVAAFRSMLSDMYDVNLEEVVCFDFQPHLNLTELTTEFLGKLQTTIPECNKAKNRPNDAFCSSRHSDQQVCTREYVSAVRTAEPSSKHLHAIDDEKNTNAIIKADLEKYNSQSLASESSSENWELSCDTVKIIASSALENVGNSSVTNSVSVNAASKGSQDGVLKNYRQHTQSLRTNPFIPRIPHRAVVASATNTTSVFSNSHIEKEICSGDDPSLELHSDLPSHVDSSSVAMCRVEATRKHPTVTDKTGRSSSPKTELQQKNVPCIHSNHDNSTSEVLEKGRVTDSDTQINRKVGPLSKLFSTITANKSAYDSEIRCQDNTEMLEHNFSHGNKDSDLQTTEGVQKKLETPLSDTYLTVKEKLIRIVKGDKNTKEVKFEAKPSEFARNLKKEFGIIEQQKKKHLQQMFCEQQTPEKTRLEVCQNSKRQKTDNSCSATVRESQTDSAATALEPEETIGKIDAGTAGEKVSPSCHLEAVKNKTKDQKRLNICHGIVKGKSSLRQPNFLPQQLFAPKDEGFFDSCESLSENGLSVEGQNEATAKVSGVETLKLSGQTPSVDSLSKIKTDLCAVVTSDTCVERANLILSDEVAHLELVTNKIPRRTTSTNNSHGNATVQEKENSLSCLKTRKDNVPKNLNSTENIAKRVDEQTITEDSKCFISSDEQKCETLSDNDIVESTVKKQHKPVENLDDTATSHNKEKIMKSPFEISNAQKEKKILQTISEISDIQSEKNMQPLSEICNTQKEDKIMTCPSKASLTQRERIRKDSCSWQSTEETPTETDKEKRSRIEVQTAGLKKCITNMLGTETKRERSEKPVVSCIESYCLANPGKDIPASCVVKFGKCGQGRGDCLFFPIGVTVNQEGNIIVTDTGNHLVKVFSKNGPFLFDIGTQLHPKLMRPSAVVVNSKNEIFVKDDLCIYSFTANGWALRRFAVNLFHAPYGLDLTSDGKLVVLEVSRNRPQVVHLSQDGQQIYKFMYQPLLSSSQGSKCRFLAINNKQLIVSDLGRSTIYVTDLDGHSNFSFGHYGHDSGEFKEPSGITVDHSGNILIGDSKNNRIQVFNSNGVFRCNVKFLEPIVRPSGIHFTNDGMLVVVNFIEHQVRIYKLGSR